VLVVGAGPAGLEAARVAAERGHHVTLLESGAEIGGQFRLAGRQPSRDQIRDLLAWYGRRLADLDVEVRLETMATAAEVAAMAADEVVLATGARPPGAGFQRALPMVDRLPGSDRPDVASIHDVLDGRAVLGRRVLVLDDLGDWRGLGTALYLAEAGHEVTIVTSAAVVGGGLFHSAADVPLRRRFAAADGVMRPHTVVLGWDDAGASTRSTLTGALDRLAADTLVIAETPVAETSLAIELSASGVAFHAIGDCVAPRRASLAIHDGRELALRL
jgi:NADPH-dependent 2,4-dienoyl-CoA reductase/sulfur reductase-like enzyme